MKFYMHSEEPELTVVIVWEKNRPGTMQEAINSFSESLKTKFPELRSCKLVCTIKNSRGKVIEEISLINNAVKHMDDLFVNVELQGDKIKEISEGVKEIGIEKSKKNKDSEYSKKDVMLSKNNAAIIHVGNCRYRKAITVYKEILDKDPGNKPAYKGIITCYKKAGRFKKALVWTKKALKLFENDVELNLVAGEVHVGCGNGDEAVEYLMKCSKLARSSNGLDTETKHELQVLLAKAYLIKDQKDMAIAVLQGVLREDTEHKSALALYAGLLFKLGPLQREEAMSVLITTLARDKNDKNAMQIFAEVCQQPGGMEVLKQVAAPVMNDSAALVFLGNCLRDFSAIKECLEMFVLALEVDPSNPSIALIYVHTLELVDRHRDIIKYYKEYCSKFPEKAVDYLTCEKVKDVINTIPDQLNDSPLSEEVLSSWKPSCQTGVISCSRQYTDEEKYLLAFWFTLVKVLFIKGQLDYIPALLELMEPLSDGHYLHQSNIRNEAAYFNCIRDLFKTYDSKIPATKLSLGEKYLYFIADSHCIPPAWQKIVVKDSTYIVHPILSTGTKIWHLRNESRFYPKVNFQSSIKNVPDNASVVVCLGEIDCREALLTCWEKARYDTIEDGMETVINIYLKEMKNLQSRHQWNLFIHPVLPVLDVTRPIVLQFNRILATMLLREPDIHWLNFVKDLTNGTEGGEMLKEEYKFDGTHVHPRYVSLLADSLSEFPEIFN